MSRLTLESLELDVLDEEECRDDYQGNCGTPPPASAVFDQTGDCGHARGVQDGVVGQAPIDATPRRVHGRKRAASPWGDRVIASRPRFRRLMSMPARVG